MTSHTLFCAKNVSEIYRLYQILNEEFLKAHKYQAEFRISTTTLHSDICLNVQDATEEERKWLMDATMQILEKKFTKVVDKR